MSPAQSPLRLHSFSYIHLKVVSFRVSITALPQMCVKLYPHARFKPVLHAELHARSLT